jgi:Ser/Thr protein kinase RdoA (MazF antagonist)
MTDPFLCHAALARHGLRARRLTPLAAHVTRVDADDGQRYALRCRPRADRVFGNIPLELAWTAALRAQTEIRPPRARPGLDGQPVQEVGAPAADDRFDCVLFEWIPGAELGRRLTPEHVRRLGVLSARLHEHAATFRPPPELPVRTLRDLVGRGELDGAGRRPGASSARRARRRARRSRGPAGSGPASRRR